MIMFHYFIRLLKISFNFLPLPIRVIFPLVNFPLALNFMDKWKCIGVQIFLVVNFRILGWAGGLAEIWTLFGCVNPCEILDGPLPLLTLVKMPSISQRVNAVSGPLGEGTCICEVLPIEGSLSTGKQPQSFCWCRPTTKINTPINPLQSININLLTAIQSLDPWGLWGWWLTLSVRLPTKPSVWHSVAVW